MNKNKKITVYFSSILLVELIFVMIFLLASQCFCPKGTVECTTCSYQFHPLLWVFSILAVLTVIVFVIYKIKINKNEKS